MSSIPRKQKEIRVLYGLLAAWIQVHNEYLALAKSLIGDRLGEGQEVKPRIWG